MWLYNILVFIVKFHYYLFKAGLSELRYRVFSDRAPKLEEEQDVAGQVVVVTGGNRGLGKATAMELAKRKAVVVMGCVDMDEGLEAVKEIKTKTGNENVEAIYLDLSDMDKVEKFATEVARKYPKIKILINNAGLGGASETWAKKKTREGFNVHVAVNHLGHFLLTNLLLENLKKGESARVVSIASTLQLMSQLDLDDLMMEKSGFGLLEMMPYCNTKYANSLFIKELGERLQGSGVTTYSLCPYFVKTQIFDSVASSGFLSTGSKYASNLHAFTPEEAASQFVMYCALNKKIANETGFMYRFKKHFDDCNVRLRSSQLRTKLWDLSEKLVHLGERLERLENNRGQRTI